MKLENTLRYRSVWMGLAMLWVVIYHASSSLIHISFFKNIGYGGVDLCLFASGVGCYYSLSKNDDIGSFLKRRVARIFPTYWCFLPFWFLYAFSAFKMKFPDVLGNIFGVQNFTGKGNAFNWYISAIVLFYILAPYMKKVVDKYDSFIKQALVVVLLFALSIPFWHSNTLIITVTRLPIFYLGMLFAKSCKNQKTLSVLKFAAYLAITVLGFVLLWVAFHQFREYRWKNGLYWYPFIMITPGLCVGVSLLMNLFEKSKFTSWIVKVLSFIGKYSFEIYLTHILIFDSVGYMIKKGTLPQEKYVYALSVVCIPLACILLSCFAKIVTKTIPSLIHRK